MGNPGGNPFAQFGPVSSFILNHWRWLRWLFPGLALLAALVLLTGCPAGFTEREPVTEPAPVPLWESVRDDFCDRHPDHGACLCDTAEDTGWPCGDTGE